MDNWLIEATDRAAHDLAGPGDWLTGAQRLEAWDISRGRSALVASTGADSDALPEAAVDVVERVSSDPGRLTRTWANERIEALGEEVYTELVGVTALASVIDTADRALGRRLRVPPAARSGDPAGERPVDVGDVGAWVAQTVGKDRANVSRTLSLVPVTNETWRGLVDRLYSRGQEFYDLSWDRPLSRPQVELVAARATAAQECFY